MATIRPFRGLRFTSADLASRVAPPYDVISPAMREELAARSANNIVHLTLPVQNDDDRSKFVKYARSASTLQHWVDSGVMKPEDTPAFYRYVQTFRTPYGDSFTRTALIALIKVEPYENGVVLPHEQTFPKHKEDRLRILEATRSHLECIFGLFEDPGQHIFRAIDGAAAASTHQVTTADGIVHSLEVISDPETLENLVRLMADRKIWIADGHHRYETALAFRGMSGERDGEIPEDFMMMALSSMEDPGLVLLPTHRILKRAPAGKMEDLLQSPYWQIEHAANSDLWNLLCEASNADQRAFGVALPGGAGLVLRVTDLAGLAASIHSDASDALKRLDVTLLHDVIFAQNLGLTGHDFFDYTRDPQEAIDAVLDGAPASFLMNPPTVEDMREIALGGEKMPQKSTYYFPKIESGLVLWRLGDF